MPADSAYGTYLRQLPNDWPTAQISSIAKVIGGGTPSRDVEAFWGGRIPWLTPGEVSGETSVYLRETRESITTAGLAGSGATLLPAGSLMITTRATLGARAINAVPMSTNQGFKSLVFGDKADARFFYYLTDKLKAELKRRASGTTFLEVSGAELATISVPLPLAGVQRLIAEILDALDTTFHQTEAIVDKLKQVKQVKQGLLHDLLTRGIDANGELRPPQSQAPELYKESVLGWIPREWSLEPIASQVRNVTYGFTNPMPTTTEGPWMLTAADIGDGRVDYSTARKTDRRDFGRLSRKSRPSIGDILVTKDGTLGRVAILDRDDVCINQSVAVLSPINPGSGAFLALYLRSPRGQDRMIADAGGSTIKHIYITTLAEMYVPSPNATEALEIGKRAVAVEARIQHESSELSKLSTLKSGLMDDLLTGRVRVTPLLQKGLAK